MRRVKQSQAIQTGMVTVSRRRRDGAAIARTGAEFLLVGGWALALHGHGRGKRAAGRAKDLADVEWLESRGEE